MPLEAGATDADYRLVYREAVVPVLGQFAPELLLVSAGFDAHERDPLASMRMTAGGYAAIVRRLTAAAPDGAIALVTEGGYDLAALASCLEASFAAACTQAASEVTDGVRCVRQTVARRRAASARSRPCAPPRRRTGVGYNL